MRTEKIDELIMGAIADTFRYQREFARSLLVNRTVGTRLTGPWAEVDVTAFRKLFTREGLFEYIPDSPGIGCRYFEVPLYPGEGVVGVLPLRAALSRNVDVYAKLDKSYGWSFMCRNLGPLPPADCVRIVLGPHMLEETKDPEHLVVWHWYPHSRAILDRAPIDEGNDILDYNDLISCARAHFDDAYVKLGMTYSGDQKIWPSVFNAQMAAPAPGEMTGEETQEIPRPEDENPTGNETTRIIVNDTNKDEYDTGRLQRLKSITSDDSKDPPETPISGDECDLRLE